MINEEGSVTVIMTDHLFLEDVDLKAFLVSILVPGIRMVLDYTKSRVVWKLDFSDI